MLPSWHFILFIIVSDSVFGHSAKINNKTHEDVQSNTERGDEDSGSGTDNNDAKYKMEKNMNTTTDNNDDGNDNNQGNVVYLNEGKGSDSSTRALQAGDTFTPMELLPVATKFFEKAKATREANQRGIVSGAKHPQEVADNIFRAYFTTDRRIVELTALDLGGLDALSALALENEDVPTRSSGNSITERPLHTLNLNGQLILADEEPLRCQYKLLFKQINPSEAILRKRPYKQMTPFPKVLKMEKKMRPNRHLVINHKGRKSRKNNNNNSSMNVHEDNDAVKEQKLEIAKNNGTERIKMTREDMGKQRKQKVARNKKSKQKRKLGKKNRKSNSTENLKDLIRNKNMDAHVPLTTTIRPACKWRYICQIPGDLDTCKLHTSCMGDGNNQPMIDKSIVDTKENEIKDREKNELVMHFRKAMGIISLDEDVEKIIELHVLKVNPQYLAPDVKIETLDEYFNNIFQAQYAWPDLMIETLDEYFNNLVKAQYTSTTRIPPEPDKPVTEIHPLQESLNEESQEQRKKNLRSSLPAEKMRYRGGEIVKDKNTAFPNVGETQKIYSRSGSTASMKAVTSKLNKYYMM